MNIDSGPQGFAGPEGAQEPPMSDLERMRADRAAGVPQEDKRPWTQPGYQHPATQKPAGMVTGKPEPRGSWFERAFPGATDAIFGKKVAKKSNDPGVAVLPRIKTPEEMEEEERKKRFGATA